MSDNGTDYTVFISDGIVGSLPTGALQPKVRASNWLLERRNFLRCEGKFLFPQDNIGDSVDDDGGHGLKAVRDSPAVGTILAPKSKQVKV